MSFLLAFIYQRNLDSAVDRKQAHPFCVFVFCVIFLGCVYVVELYFYLFIHFNLDCIYVRRLPAIKLKLPNLAFSCVS